jgi:hypothetical protein
LRVGFRYVARYNIHNLLYLRRWPKASFVY